MKNLKISLPIIVFLASATLSYPQEIKKKFAPCYFDQLIHEQGEDPYLHQKFVEANAKIWDKLNAPSSFSKKKNSDFRTIPVVVHVIHNGGSEKISEAQVQSQIDIMNEDYGKFPGTNGDGNGVDTKVRFCLAKISPKGNCTNGIVYIKSTLTNHKSYERALLKELSFWDNTRYLNMYVVRTINGGVLGYSSFPDGPPDADGIVIRHTVFGNTGTASSSLGRTAAHELGHWFGLYHTFQDSCGTDTCTTGDLICDTPPVAAPNFGCPSNVNSCSNDNQNDQVENYMDYSNDACKNMFTNGQKMRMQATLDTIRTVIWSNANHISTGCDTNYTPPATCDVVADLVTLNTEICSGNSIYFMDKSLNGAITWQWLFPGGNPDFSALQNPTITYDSIGTYSVTLIVSDSNTTDYVTFTDYITVSNPGVGNPLPFLEDFESGAFPQQGVTLNNPDQGVTWEIDSLASVSGKYSLKINNLINTNYGSSDEIILPFFDLTTDTNTTFLKFNWAYARSDPSFSDDLIVLASKDCGQSFNQVFFKSGNSLATGPTQTTPFVPDSSQWDSASVFLGTYANESYVLLKIVNVTDGGNNLYIDDINIGDLSLLPPPVSLEDKVKEGEVRIFPNPASTVLKLQFPNEKMQSGVISVTDVTGKLVTTLSYNKQELVELNITHLENGVYFLNIDNSWYSKFIVNH